DHGDGRLAERLGGRGIVGEQLAHADRAGETGRAPPDQNHADVDALVLAGLRSRDEFTHPYGRWVVGGAAGHGGEDNLPRVHPVDLRSDTVTRPTSEMRRA